MRTDAVKRARLPRYRRADSPPPMQLTERDEQVIAWVHELRFATQEQIQRLVFGDKSPSVCKRRLTLLYHNQWLDRRLIPLRSSFGANRAAYCLDHKGADLVELRYKTGSADSLWRPRDSDQEFTFILHLLASNDVRVAVTLAAQARDTNVEWTDERILRRRAMRDLIPDSRRPGQHLVVVPDGHFFLDDGATRQSFALELDRGTVAERPFREKVRALGEWKRSGLYERRFGTRNLRVLFVVAPTSRDPARFQRIQHWAAAEGAGAMFWFGLLPLLTPDSVLNLPVWSVAGRQGTYSLLESPRR